MFKIYRHLCAFSLLLLSAAPVAQAGVFSTPRFVQPGSWAFGVEPEVVLTHGAGVGVNFRFTQGLNDLMNGTAILGTGSGPRRFRVGGNLTFDFIPDIESQPGIGIAAQAIYFRLPNSGKLEMTGVPYIHKAFKSGGTGEVEPYFAFPFGLGFSGGRYEVVSTAVIGAMFKTANDHIRYITELGVNVNHSETYFSGGLVYFH